MDSALLRAILTGALETVAVGVLAGTAVLGAGGTYRLAGIAAASAAAAEVLKELVPAGIVSKVSTVVSAQSTSQTTPK